MIQNSEGACQMIFLVKDILLYAIEWGRFGGNKFMCQSKLLSFEYFSPKIFLLGRTQCQEFYCLFRAKRYGQPCITIKTFRKEKIVSFFFMPKGCCQN